MDLQKTYLYRMVHMNNIPHVLQHGITHRESPNANSVYEPIGDSSLISHRNSREVMVTNGKTIGFGWPTMITLGDFIPFYFGFRTPMLYVIQKGVNFVPKPTPPVDVVYCVTAVGKIMESGVTYYFSDGHAVNSLSTFYDSTMVNEMDKLVDFDAAKAKQWIDEKDLDLKRRKEAEFLIQQDLPPDYLLGFVCYNSISEQKLLSFGIPGNKISVRPNYYFDL